MYDQSTTVLEEWRPIAGYDDRYSVSSLGRIRRDAPGRNTHPGYILIGSKTKRGYSTVNLRTPDGRVTGNTIHKLVAAAFIGPRPPGLTVNHKDGVKSNNRAVNLEYATHAEQKIHAKRLGLLAAGERNGNHLHPESRPRGERHGSHTHPESTRRGSSHEWAERTEDEVRAIRLAVEKREATQEQLARHYHMSQTGISRIIRRHTWKHVI